MNEILKTISDIIQPSPTALMLRNLIIIVVLAWLLYKFVFGRRGSWLREKVPALKSAEIRLEAKRLMRKGEYAQAGEVLLSSGLDKQAIEVFLEGQLFGRAADVYLAKRNLQKAAGLYEKAGQFEKAAQLYIERKDFEKAEENLSRVGKNEEIAHLYESMGAHSLAADAYEKMGRLKETVRLLEEKQEFLKAAKKLQEVYGLGDPLRIQDAGFSDAHLLGKKIGELFMKAKEPLSAADIFTKEKFFKEAGDAFESAKEFEKAIECYTKGDHFKEAAQVYYKLGKHDKAASLEAEGYIRDGDESKAAKAYLKAGDYASAGDVYRNLGDFGKAGEMYEKAREFALAGSMFREAGEYERGGACFERAKNFEEAVELYGLAENYARQVALLEKERRFVEAAENYLDRGLVDEAEQLLQKVTQDDPGYKRACALEGKILLEKGELSQAKEKLEQAVSNIEKLEKDNIGTIMDLAKVSEQLGEHSNALHTIEKMLAEDFVKAEQNDPMSDIKKRLSSVLTQSSRRSSVMNAPAFASAISLSGQEGVGTTTKNNEEQRYIPIKEIGKGGMGVVYTARDIVLDRVIALKVLPASLKKNKQAVATFLREGRNAAALNHKNIVTVHDAGMQSGEYFIAMELVDGLTIKEIIKKNKRLSLRSVYAVAKQLIDGLGYAHAKNIVHRDLTNNNIMWSTDKLVKIMDFGLAKVVRELQSEQSIIGGTPSYMSPEQTLGNPIDHRTDIYSLGVCFYEMCIGELPFRKGNLGYHHVHTPAPDPSEKNPSLPDSLVSVILKCLEKAPEKRPQSVDEVFSRLSEDKLFMSL